MLCHHNRRLASNPGNEFDVVPYLQPTTVFPEQMPELEPSHPVRTEALMKVVITSVKTALNTRVTLIYVLKLNVKVRRHARHVVISELNELN
jgi:hypothetical protein